MLRSFYIFFFQCIDDRSLLKLASNEQNLNNSTQSSETIVDAPLLKKLCPVFLYQLVAPTSVERQGCIFSTISNIDAHKHEARYESNLHPHHHNQNMFSGNY